MLVKLDIGERVIVTCRVAYSHPDKITGLRDSPEPKDKEGMLFLWDEPRDIEMTMYGMRFPLDILFCGEDGRVERIVPSVKPGVLSIRGYGSAVIELRAGTCEAYGISVGDLVTT
jgi:hypothetical protein